MKTHELKCWPLYFNQILEGCKRFEVRKNDRGFCIGDRILLREWRATDQRYTSRACVACIDYIMHPNPAVPALKKGYVVMSISPESK